MKRFAALAGIALALGFGWSASALALKLKWAGPSSDGTDTGYVLIVDHNRAQGSAPTCVGYEFTLKHDDGTVVDAGTTVFSLEGRDGSGEHTMFDLETNSDGNMAKLKTKSEFEYRRDDDSVLDFVKLRIRGTSGGMSATRDIGILFFSPEHLRDRIYNCNFGADAAKPPDVPLTATFTTPDGQYLKYGDPNSEFSILLKFFQGKPDVSDFSAVLSSFYIRDQGEVTNVREVNSTEWVVTVHPRGFRGWGLAKRMTVGVHATTDCAAPDAICTSSGRKLARGPNTYVNFRAGEDNPQAQVSKPDPEPPTAEFRDQPASHDGETAFTVRLGFSEDVEISPEDLRDHALSASGGTVTGVSRVEDAKDLFEVTLDPAGDAAVTLMLGPTPSDCTADGAVCTAEGTALMNAYAIRVRGPGPGLTVADAEATEGDDASLDFVVTLSPAATEEVTVSYATSDGTATEPADYTAKSGTLTFTAGETSKTVSVDIIDDTEEDDGETVKFTLSGAAGAAIDDHQAIGTIRNTEEEEEEEEEEVTDALTASFESVPSEHDGSSRFELRVRFSEELAARSRRKVSRALSISGATQGMVRRVGDTRDFFKFPLTPSGDGAVTVSLGASSDCSANDSLCTPDGQALAEALEVTIPGPTTEPTIEPTPEPLTASFESVPSEHDGSSGFELRVRFSEELAAGSGRKVARALSISGATRGYVLRVGDTRDFFKFPLTPSGDGAVTVSLGASSDCSANDSLCTTDSRALSESVEVTVQGPPGLSVADAEVEEAATDAALGFAVTLSRAASGAVTVAYATADGTATEPADYTSTSGTLTFAAGESSKTVSVPVHGDALDEGSETLTLTLSSPTGAYLEDATATGTIKNTGPMPQAWLGRFGRTVADQVLNAVGARLGAARAPGLEARVAGQALSFDTAAGNAGALQAREEEAQALAGWLRGEERAGLSETRALSARELLAGTSFALTGGSAGGGSVSAWGRGTVSSFDGREDELRLDGEIGNLLLGADLTQGRATAGLVLSHARGSGAFAGASSGDVEASLSGLYPYGRYAVSERVSVWGVVGYGEGTLRVDPEDQRALETDMDLAMGSVGARGVLLKAPPEGGAELAIKSDALALRTSSDAVGTSTGNLAEAEAEVTRLRFGLEGSRAFRFEGGASLTPSVELGVRHDGGDAETGFGADIGAGLAWSDPARGLSADVRARGLLTHEDGHFSERGFAGSLAWDPAPGSARGPSLAISQTLGAEASGGMEALLRPESTLMREAANDDGAGLERRALQAKLGYGFALFGGRYTGTPELGLGLGDAGRELVLGWRLQGADAGRFQARLEGSRFESAADNPEHRIGLTFNARW